MDDLYTILEDLEIQINEGKRVLLTNQYAINRDVVMAIIQALRDSLPEAVQRANSVLEQEKQLLETATNTYNNTIADAESKAHLLEVDSKQRADRLLADAKAQADALYTDAQRQAGELVAGAERQAKETVAGAERKAKELVAQSTIMQEADREASRIKAEAKAAAQRDRVTALGLCDELLQRAEDAAIAVANELRDARMSYDKNR